MFLSSPSIQKKSKTPWKLFSQGSRLDADSCFFPNVEKKITRKNWDPRLECFVACLTDVFRDQLVLKGDSQAKKHPKKKPGGSKMSFLNDSKNVIFQNLLLEVCSFELRPSSEIVDKCLRISVRSALFELARSAGRAHRSWRRIGIFNLTPAESLVLWKQRWTFGSKQPQKKRWRLKTHGVLRGMVGDSFFNSKKTGETPFKLQSEEF